MGKPKVIVDIGFIPLRPKKLAKKLVKVSGSCGGPHPLSLSPSPSSPSPAPPPLPFPDKARLAKKAAQLAQKEGKKAAKAAKKAKEEEEEDGDGDGDEGADDGAAGKEKTKMSSYKLEELLRLVRVAKRLLAISLACKTAKQAAAAYKALGPSEGSPMDRLEAAHMLEMERSIWDGIRAAKTAHGVMRGVWHWIERNQCMYLKPTHLGGFTEEQLSKKFENLRREHKAQLTRFQEQTGGELIHPYVFREGPESKSGAHVDKVHRVVSADGKYAMAVKINALLHELVYESTLGAGADLATVSMLLCGPHNKPLVRALHTILPPLPHPLLLPPITHPYPPLQALIPGEVQTQDTHNVTLAVSPAVPVPRP